MFCETASSRGVWSDGVGPGEADSSVAELVDLMNFPFSSRGRSFQASLAAVVWSDIFLVMEKMCRGSTGSFFVES